MNTTPDTTIGPPDANARTAGNGNGRPNSDSSNRVRAVESAAAWVHGVHEQQAAHEARLRALECDKAENREARRRVEECFSTLVATIKIVPQIVTQGMESLLNRTRQISEQQERESHNSEQIRLQSEQAARKMEELSADFTQRNVEDPLYRELLKFATRLSMASSNTSENEDGEVHAVASDILRLLEERGLTLIRPTQGDLFDSRIHRPIETVETDDETKVKHLAKVYHPGLKREHRVVEPARVAILVPNTSKQQVS